MMSFLQSELFLTFLFTALLLAAIASSFYVIRKWEASLIRRLSLAAVIPSFFTFLFIIIYSIRWSVFKEQNWIRLQRTIAWAMGHPLYPDPQTGPVMAAIYGPVSALAYWPAAWLDSPFPAIQTGIALSMLFFFLPVFGLILHRKPGEPRCLLTSLLVCFCFFFLSTILTSLKEAAYTIHADAPALGCGALACGFLYFTKPEGSHRKAFWLSALFMMLALASKQTAAPLLISLPLYVFLAYGFKAFRSYLFSVVITGGIFLVLFFFIFDAGSFVYHTLFLPSRHPTKLMDAEMLLKSGWRLGREILIILAVSLPGVWHAFSRGIPRPPVGDWFRKYPWTLFFLTGFCMAPLAFLSHIKVGGSNNTLSFAGYFLLTGGALALIRSARAVREEGEPLIFMTSRSAVLVYSFVLLLITIPVGFYRIVKFDNQEPFGKRAYEYVRQNPGQAYFPRLTLVHLMGEGRLYHAADGIMDRAWAGVPVTKEHFRRHIPENLQLIAFGTEDHRKKLPIEDFATGYVNDTKLPGFTVYPRQDN